MMDINLKQNIESAARWSAITEFTAKLIAPVTNMILARLLHPEAFGVVATLMMVVSFAELFTDAGFQKYLVQHEFSDDSDYELSTNVAFWTNLLLSFLIWGVVVLLAEPIANLTGVPGCETAIAVISIEIPLFAFSSIQMARYRRKFDFKSLFVARMATAVVPLVVTVPLALLMRSYWALVWGTLARDVLNALVLTIRSTWKPRFYYNIQKLKKMVSFGIWTVVENITIWLTSYIDTFIVGISLSTYYLGIYKTTMNTVNALMGIISSATVSVLFSALSRCQNDEKLFQRTFCQFQRMSALLVLPLGFGVFVYRKLAVSIVLGSQWQECVNFFGLWALTLAITIVLSSYNSEVFRSKGKPKLSVLSQCLHLTAIVPVLFWGMDKGFETLATVRSLVRFQGILVSMLIMHYAMKISFFTILKNVWCPFFAAVVMALAGAILRTAFDSVLWELLTVIFCIFIYAGLMLLIPAGRKLLAEIPILRKLFRLKAVE